MYDAVIVGACCAGASTALLLARAGLNILLVDRARVPSEIPHEHFSHRHGSFQADIERELLPVLDGVSGAALRGDAERTREFYLASEGLVPVA